MKTSVVVRAALVSTGLIILAGFIVKTQSQVRPPDVLPASEKISRHLYFGQRIVQVGTVPASEEESQILLALLENLAANNYRAGLAELEEYLAAITNSPWPPSLDAALGRFYFDMGRYTLVKRSAKQPIWLAKRRKRLKR